MYQMKRTDFRSNRLEIIIIILVDIILILIYDRSYDRFSQDVGSKQAIVYLCLCGGVFVRKGKHMLRVTAKGTLTGGNWQK